MLQTTHSKLNVCDEHVCSLQLEQWYSTSGDSELQMYVAHYLGECRSGTYTMTIFTYVRSYYKTESPSERCMWSEPRITA